MQKSGLPGPGRHTAIGPAFMRPLPKRDAPTSLAGRRGTGDTPPVLE